MILVIELKRDHKWDFGCWSGGANKPNGFYLCLWFVGLSIYWGEKGFATILSLGNGKIRKTLNKLFRGKPNWNGDLTSS